MTVKSKYYIDRDLVLTKEQEAEVRLAARRCLAPVLTQLYIATDGAAGECGSEVQLTPEHCDGSGKQYLYCERHTYVPFERTEPIR